MDKENMESSGTGASVCFRFRPKGSEPLLPQIRLCGAHPGPAEPCARTQVQGTCAQTRNRKTMDYRLPFSDRSTGALLAPSEKRFRSHSSSNDRGPISHAANEYGLHTIAIDHRRAPEQSPASATAFPLF